MPKHSKPRSGSLAYWPRKRARRIYPRIKTYPQEAVVRPLAFAGYKVGMLHAIVIDSNKNSPTFGQEISVPVTVLDCPPLLVVGIRAYVSTTKGLKVLTETWEIPKKLKKDLERKVKIGKNKLLEIEQSLDKIKSLRLIVATQPRLAIGKKKPEVFEIELGGSVKEKFEFAKAMLGKEIKVSEVLKEGELVDAIGITKGKGTAGPVKRFGIKIQPPHAKGKRRHTGSLGQERPGKVRPTVPQAGQLGFQRRTELNKRILKIGSGDITPPGGFKRYGVVKGDYVLIEGSIPGAKKRLVILRPAIRAGAKVVKEVKKIVK